MTAGGRHIVSRGLVVLILASACLMPVPVVRAADDTPAPPPRPPSAADRIDPHLAADLFAMPEITAATRTAAERFAAGDADSAATILDGLIARHPDLGTLRADRAALALLAGDTETALAELEEAAARGIADPAVLADPVFAPLATDPATAARIKALRAVPAPPPGPEPVATPVSGGRAEISAANTAWNPDSERLEARFSFPDAASTPVLPARKVAAWEILREHVRRGRAAGNHGDLYDNRDRGHSTLAPEAHPQLSHVTYHAAARKAGLDYGLGDRLLFDHPTFGNSSTAITAGPHWRSLPRYALTRPDGTGPMRLWQNLRANHLYIHPAHKDFTDEGGDIFPANTPYLLVSRGSSGSDQPFLEAVAMIYAAFRPDTKARLIDERMLVPTVQMVFRRSLQNVRSRDAYFSGDAHPSAFQGWQINPARMVSLANSIAEADIPAEVRIRVEQEDLGTEGIDFFGLGLDERLFDTPQAVARIWRSHAGRRSMIVSAAESRDANNRDLTFHWHLLQGDPERVTIEPLGDGTRARITLDWHESFPISEDDPTVTSRVDIGVFAHNGVHDSAPAIVSWYFPPHETRIHEDGPDGAPRLVSLDHADPEKAEIYADPLLLPRADWRDAFTYTADGALAGWTRHRGDRTEDYTATGARILTRTPDGTPDRTEAVAYPLRAADDGALHLREVSVGGFPG